MEGVVSVNTCIEIEICGYKQQLDTALHSFKPFSPGNRTGHLVYPLCICKLIMKEAESRA